MRGSRRLRGKRVFNGYDRKLIHSVRSWNRKTEKRRELEKRGK